jgi:hypothetical protein
MSTPTREKLISAYKRLVEQREGDPVGERIFMRQTGYSHHYWNGQYWRSWSAFQSDAGYAPNVATEKTPDDVILQRFAELALELNWLPTEADLMIKRKEDPSFPSKSTYRRWGGRDALLAKVAEYCESHERFAPVLELYRRGISGSLEQRIEDNKVKGFVYLIRSGKSYKLGRSNAIGRCLRELAIQLPQKPDTVHVIETDDPEGIEQYWHRRFAEKRQEGEWFALTPDDVRAFRRRNYQ